ncbi:MAG: hypothetical protein RLZZ01_2561, partial [Actinomycetota bacterium]
MAHRDAARHRRRLGAALPWGLDHPGSFNGRTAVFGAAYRGSNPLPGTMKHTDVPTPTTRDIDAPDQDACVDRRQP